MQRYAGRTELSTELEQTNESGIVNESVIIDWRKRNADFSGPSFEASMTFLRKSIKKYNWKAARAFEPLECATSAHCLNRTKHEQQRKMSNGGIPTWLRTNTVNALQLLRNDKQKWTIILSANENNCFVISTETNKYMNGECEAKRFFALSMRCTNWTFFFSFRYEQVWLNNHAVY